MKKISENKTHITIQFTISEIDRIDYIMREFLEAFSSPTWNKEHGIIKRLFKVLRPNTG